MTGRDIDDIRADIDTLVAEYAQAISDDPDDDRIILGWALAFEATSVRLEQDDAFAGGIAHPTSQAAAMTRGLMAWGLAWMTNGVGRGD